MSPDLQCSSVTVIPKDSPVPSFSGPEGFPSSPIPVSPVILSEHEVIAGKNASNCNAAEMAKAINLFIWSMPAIF